MKGKHHIVIEAPRLKYEFTVRRNITLIQGDSATGKTTLIDLLQDLGRNAAPVRISSDVGCRVFSGEEDEWQRFLEGIHGEIIFIDEGYAFIRSKEFAELVRRSDNYYVLITREALPCLPYSIREIYGIRTSGKYHFPEQIYHEFYQIYPEPAQKQEERIPPESDAQETDSVILVEDAKSGYFFLQHCCNESGACVSAGGNTKLYDGLRNIGRGKKVVIIADGAAPGAP